MDKQFTITLSAEYINIVAAGLNELQAKVANPVLQEITKQLVAQQEAPAEAPAEAEKAE